MDLLLQALLLYLEVTFSLLVLFNNLSFFLFIFENVGLRPIDEGRPRDLDVKHFPEKGAFVHHV